MNTFYNFNLKEYNSYGIHAFCKRAFFPENVNDFISIFRHEERENLVLLGRGYNVIFSKPAYNESFIIINENYASISVEDHFIFAESGADMRLLSSIAHQHGLSGFEPFCDIPGSVGGALVMNAGAGGFEIKDILDKVSYLDIDDMTIKTLSRSAIDFEYRGGFFQRNKNKIILSATFKLTSGNKDEIKSSMDRIIESRRAKQPWDFPNAGSVFKRPFGKFVGAMVEELGLKGFSIGGAKVSDKHAGFIINYDKATGNDVIQLIDYIRKAVQEKFGVQLEVEQRII